MKHLFKQTGWFIILSLSLVTSCQQEEILTPPTTLPKNAETATRAASPYNFLEKRDGIFVLSEGNMSNENGTISFIDGSASSFPAHNWVYRAANPNKEIGNVAQDMFITDNKAYILAQNGHRDLLVAGNVYNMRGANHILVANQNMTRINDFNPGNYFAAGWTENGATPTHLAVSGNKIFVRTNNAVVVANETNPNIPPAVIPGISNPSRIRMAMIRNGTTRYLYVGSTDNKVYRINTTNNQVSSITVQGKVAGLVAVRRNNNSRQYIWALCIKPDGLAVVHKISGTRVQATLNIGISPSPFDAGLLIPSVGLCCDARTTNDILYFRGNGWNPKTIYKFNTANSNVASFYTVPAGIDSRARIIYGDIGVNPSNGNLYFGYVGDWISYVSVNGVVQLNNNGQVLKEYRPSFATPNKIDTRFTAGIYFRREFNM